MELRFETLVHLRRRPCFSLLFRSVKGCTYARGHLSFRRFAGQVAFMFWTYWLSLWRSTGFGEAFSLHQSHATFPSVGLFLFTTLPMCDDFILLP
jgi:hypothetical protein